jgi:hypothetical protein
MPLQVLTGQEIADLNLRTCNSLGKVKLGTRVADLRDRLDNVGRIVAVKHTVTAGEVSANQVSIDTNLSTVTTLHLTYTDSSGAVKYYDLTITEADGMVTIAEGTDQFVAGDVIHLLVRGPANG